MLAEKPLTPDSVETTEPDRDLGERPVPSAVSSL